eukprot:gene7060-157_t
MQHGQAQVKGKVLTTLFQRSISTNSLVQAELGDATEAMDLEGGRGDTKGAGAKARPGGVASYSRLGGLGGIFASRGGGSRFGSVGEVSLASHSKTPQSWAPSQSLSPSTHSSPNQALSWLNLDDPPPNTPPPAYPALDHESISEADLASIYSRMESASVYSRQESMSIYSQMESGVLVPAPGATGLDRRAVTEEEETEGVRLLGTRAFMDASDSFAGVLRQDGHIAMFKPKTASFWGTFTDLPWDAVPFLLGMFVMVEGLQVQGWIHLLAEGLVGADGGTLGGALWLVGGASILLVNLISN